MCLWGGLKIFVMWGGLPFDGGGSPPSPPYLTALSCGVVLEEIIPNLLESRSKSNFNQLRYGKNKPAPTSNNTKYPWHS